MAITLIRSLTATVVRNVTALKRDAKRLQKHSGHVFGTEYPLKVCQQAVAVSRGFKSLSDVENLAQRLGMDKQAPFWTILGRNDRHQDVLNAIYRLGIEYTENGPVVFTGEQEHSIDAALVLFFEQMSLKKLPGLILVETEAASLQDTIIYGAIKRLGAEDVLDGFRSLDLRDRNLPVSISTEARWWVEAITDVLPKNIQENLKHSGWADALTRSAHENAKSRNQMGSRNGFEPIPFYSVNEAAKHLAYYNAQPLWVTDDKSWPYDSVPKIEKDDERTVLDLINTLNSRKFDVGVSCEHESLWRPYVVLFSRNDPASEVLAGAVRSYFSWRQHRDQKSPVLYVSDGATPYAPRFLCFGEHTAVVNGLDTIPAGDDPGEFYGYKQALRVLGTSDGLQFMGKRVSMD